MHLHFQLIKDWPPLSWLAECSASSSIINVYHGDLVEVRKDWFCEAVWDGSFESGAFDQTDVIFGSGGRVTNGYLTFVSSASTVDRLQAIEYKGVVYVSNSLVCLLSYIDASLDPAYPRYYKDFETIIHGLDNYKRSLSTSAGEVRLHYFHNVHWDGQQLAKVEKPTRTRDFSTYSKYRDFLEESLGKLSKNMSATTRTHAYAMLGTLSRGYDSPAVAVLAKQFGLKEVITFLKARNGYSDDGSVIANLLGLRIIGADRHDWQSNNFSEIPFIASDAKGEDAHFMGVEASLKGRVLLTGFPDAWDKDSALNLSPHILRKCQAGLSLTEYRLWAGFIHLPVPYLGIRQEPDILRLSQSAEMETWNVKGTYNKPICRRIIEEAGIPRNEFGLSKKATSIIFSDREEFLPPISRKDFHQWLSMHVHLWTQNFRLSPYAMRKIWILFYPLFRLGGTIARALYIFSRRAPQGWGKTTSLHLAEKLTELDRKEYLAKYLFPWAIERAKKRYAVRRVNSHEGAGRLHVKHNQAQ